MARCSVCGKPVGSAEAAAFNGRHEDCYASTFSARTVGQFGEGAQLYLGLAPRIQQPTCRRGVAR